MSDAYCQARQAAGRVREEPHVARGASELELQAGFYRGDFGVCWTGTDGENVEVIHPGHWNREPGPDFRGALLKIDGEECAGDIEIDPHARDWEAHGHSGNPAFGDVRLHAFFQTGAKRFFTRDFKNRAIVQVLLELPCEKIIPKDPVSFEPQERLDGKNARELIRAAAKYRLHRKRDAFLRACKLCGEEEALFQALAAALGYKNNKVPFVLVAQRAGLARARAEGGEALLYGLAGFLRAVDFDSGDEEERCYLGTLWQEWWTQRDRESRLILSDEIWNLAGVRPANHPHRRMGALALIARAFPRLHRALAEGSQEEFAGILTSLEHPYWRTRWNLRSARLSRAAALLGEDRALDMVINVFVPGLSDAGAGERVLDSLAGPSMNSKARAAAEWLCGETKGFSSAFLQQGLLQLHEDFFLQNPVRVWENYRRRST